MSQKTILIVDDDAHLRKTLYDILVVKGYAPIAVRTGQAALEHVAKAPPMLALIDLRLEDMPGLELIRKLKELSPRTEFIVLTGHASQSSAIKAIDLGAYSYVQKPYDIEQLLVTIRRAIEKQQAEEERILLVTQIQEQAQQLQQVMDAVPEAVLLLDREQKIALANPTAREDLRALADLDAADVLTHLGGRPLSELLAPPASGAWHQLESDGRSFEVIARPTPTGSEDTEWVLVIRDMTDEREIQQRMRHNDRLAVIGQLAGGVAHEFRNRLTTILGYTQFVLDDLVADDPIRDDLEEVKKAGERASSLTNQLLIFSRKQILQPRVMLLNATIADMEKMLRRLIGEDIDLRTALDPSLGRVKADPGQMEQVVMNLSVNARDAMPRGGQLTLETKNVVLDESYVRELPDVEPGPYVMLAVSDFGTGMTDEVQAHLFEPFFTTKGKGKGTGLGLATVYGIVKQSGGHIGVYSELGVGTTFKVYLPQLGDDIRLTGLERPGEALIRGTETILLVEDEVAVRKFARRALERYGYTVLEVPSPAEALRLGEQYGGPIAMMVTDVVMPEMGGRNLAERLSSLRPEMKVLYMSGYTDEAISRHGILEPGVAFLEKPFSLTGLARKVREVLDTAQE